MEPGGGGAGGNRTRDLLNAIQALSQLSYGPTKGSRLVRASDCVKGMKEGAAEGSHWVILPAAAGVAKLVYAGDSKSPGFTAMRVRVPPPAPDNRDPACAKTRLQHGCGPTSLNGTADI